MALIQLDFFEPQEYTVLKTEIDCVKKSNDKVRKGMFARHNELTKMYNELKERLELLENHICKGNIQVDEAPKI